MSAPADKSELTEREAADLSALADGSLDPARRQEVQAWAEASPERARLFERERRVVELLRDVSTSERAPERLRARVEATRPRALAAARRRRLGWTGLAGAAAAVAAALVLVLPGSAPTLVQASAVATLGPVQPPPTPDPQAPARLGGDVQEVYFPNWSTTGWRASGQRTDTINGRKMVTVYYQWGSAKIAYTIVSSPALAQPNAPVSYVGGLALRTLTLNGRQVVIWQRDDHTCILSTAHGVAPTVLRGLAAWHPTTD